MPKYRANNQIYNIPVEEEQRFLQAFPTAELIEEEEVKQQPTVETTAPAVGSRRITQPNVGVSQQAVGSSVSQQPKQEEEYEPNILQSLAAKTARGFADVFKGFSSAKDAIIFSALNVFDPDMTPKEKTALYERIEAVFSSGVILLILSWSASVNSNGSFPSSILNNRNFFFKYLKL